MASFAHRSPAAAADGAAGLDTIGARGSAHGISWDVAPARPYDLRFENRTDVVCLLLGGIDARTGYDGDRPAPMRFEPLTTAFHPGGGEVLVHASRVTSGFIAFTFPEGFRERMFGDDCRFEGTGRSVHNIASPRIAHLVSYARTAIAGGRLEDSFAQEALAGLAYGEAIAGMATERRRVARRAPSRRQIARLIEHIDGNLGQSLSHAELARVADVPIATLRRQFRRETGRSLHQFVLDRRVEAAVDLLRGTQVPIAEIAASCGFCSQQHMTTVFSDRLGRTPAAFRGQPPD